jgi:hypothetical protein
MEIHCDGQRCLQAVGAERAVEPVGNGNEIESLNITIIFIDT